MRWPNGDAPTDRQQDIYDYLRDFIAANGYPPTIRQIGKANDISSPNGVMCHLKALEKKGYITRLARGARCIVLCEESEHPAVKLLRDVLNVAKCAPLPCEMAIDKIAGMVQEFLSAAQPAAASAVPQKCTNGIGPVRAG